MENESDIQELLLIEIEYMLYKEIEAKVDVRTKPEGMTNIDKLRIQNEVFPEIKQAVESFAMENNMEVDVVIQKLKKTLEIAEQGESGELFYEKCEIMGNILKGLENQKSVER